MQVPLVGAEMVSELAVTAPVESAVPTARAHWPTTMADAVAVTVVVNVVVPVRVTVTLDVFLVCGSVSLTVTVDPLTAVTWPDAAPKSPGLNVPPPGRVPVPPVPEKPWKRLAPAGRVPPPNPPPNPPLEQVPDVGWVIVTVVAVIGSPNGVDDEDGVVGLPNAEMQEPTVTPDAVVVVICRIVVADV